MTEICADGTEVRSLAGRSARLGDGTSRNPENRDELLAQRTRDLGGMIGQVRGFDVDEFLSDWEQPGQALPWALGDSAWVSDGPGPSASASQKSRPRLTSVLPSPGAMEVDVVRDLHAAGVSTKLKVE